MSLIKIKQIEDLQDNLDLLDEITKEFDVSSYDLANTTYASKTFSVDSEDDAPGALFVRGDGLKMYMASGANQTIFQYSITGGDVNTGSFDNISLDVSNEATAVLVGLSIKPDMSIIIAFDAGTDKVFQYNNSDPDDISNAVFSSKSFDFTGETPGISGIYVTPDGQFLFASDNSNGLIRRYSFGTPWQVDTLSHDNKSLDFSSEGAAARGVSVSADGRKVFVVQSGGNSKIFQYTLTTAFDTGTGSYDGVFLDLSSEGTIPTDLFFFGDGKTLYTSDRTGGVGDFFQYEHSTSDVDTPATGEHKVFFRGDKFFSKNDAEEEVDLSDEGMEKLFDDKTPKLGGNLDLDINVITGLEIGIDLQAFDADTAKLDVAQEYTATQNFNATTLTDAANISWDASANQVTSVILTDNRTLDDPTNMVDGATYVLIVKQDATGTRTLAYGSAYKFPSGTAPTLSTGANDVDIISFVSDGTSMFGVAQLDFS